MQVHLLGALQVSVDDGRSVALGGHRQRMVLAVLLLHAGQPVTFSRLIDDVWGDEPPPTARKTLQVYVSRLRRALGEGSIGATRDGYVLRAGPAEIDAARFERLAAEGRRLLETDPAAAAAVLRDALALWRGAPWGELADEPALAADADRLRELRLTVLEDRLTADLALGDAAALVGELRALVSDHPVRERLRGLLMTALYRQGQTADALTAFEQGRRILGDELGADPGPALQQVHRRILQADPLLLIASGTVTPPADGAPVPNPYKGLLPFGETDAGSFFGREELVEELLLRLSVSSFVALVGPSGSGKSSVVRAGLVPALRNGGLDGSGGWHIAPMRPGAHPFAQLDAALLRSTPDLRAEQALPHRGDDLDLLRAVLQVVPDDGGRLVLVIDQFEELFLQVDEAERDRFLRNLAEAAEDPHSRLLVVAVIRADLLDRPLAHPRLGPLLVEGLVHVLPLRPAELEAACVTPAARVGVTVEPELAAELVAEVVDRPGALPLFQYTLTELFERRAGDTITRHDDRELGGLHGVVARRAEETFATLGEDSRLACRQVFLRLVAVGDEGEVGRRRATREELDSLVAHTAAVGLVLERFAAARLLAFGRDPTTGQATVELAHEALLRAWPRLATWIDDSQDDLRVQRGVAAAAAEWSAAGRHEDYLLAGARLALAVAWSGRDTAAPAAAELELIDASLAREAQDHADEQARQRRELELERRAARRLRLLAGVLAVAAVVAAALGGAAMVQRSRAQEQTAAARAATELMRARQLASTAVATREVDAQLSLLLALHATAITSQADIAIPDELVAALHWALQAARVPYPGDAAGTAVAGPQGPQGIFPMPVDELVALAHANVERDLTPRECAEHLDLRTCPPLPDTWPPLRASDLPPVPAQSRSTCSDMMRDDRCPPLAGTSVAVGSTITSPQSEGLIAELDAFGERNGITIDYTPLADFQQSLADAVEGSGPSVDIAIPPQPYLLASYARNGAFIDVSRYLDPQALRAAMSPHLVSLTTVADDGTWPADDGGVYGVFLKIASKSTVWYSIPAFEQNGYEVPRSYDDLLALTRRIVADGGTPWCYGEGAGGQSGWPGTDLIENLLLRDSQAAYDAWLAHEIGFDSPPMRRAFGRMADLLLEPGHVVGGQAIAARLDWATAAAPLVADPPGCVLSPLASYAPAAFPFGTRVGRDVGVFHFPPITPGAEPVVVGGGDVAVALTDRPEVREVMRFLAGGPGEDDFGRLWARMDRTFISPRTDFPADAYVICGENPDSCKPDPVRTALAPTISDALARDRFRFDGSDILPLQMGLEPMWEAMVEFTGAGPANLDRILAELDATWEQREQEAER